MCVGEEKGVLSKVELILPANVVEACYNLERNVHAYFMAVNQQDRTSSEITLYKLKDDSVKIRVTVLALGDEDEEESAPQPPTPRGGKRKKGPSGDGDDEPSTSRAKRKPDGEPSPSTKKGKGRGKGVKDEEPTPAPSTPTVRRAAAAGVSPSPGRLRTAKTVRNVAKTAANLEDFIPEDGDFIEQTAVTQSGDQVLVVSQAGAEPVEVTVGGPGSMAEVQVGQQQMTGEEDEAMAEEMYGGEEDDEYVQIDPNTTASTVITVKKAIKTEEEKAAERVRKVSMGRPWNWGKKTTLVYERKEKSLGKKGECDQEEMESPKPTETVVIRARGGKGMVSAQDFASSLEGNKSTPGRTKVMKIEHQGDGDMEDPEMPPIVLANEDGAIISADAIELSDAMGGTVQVQVVSEEGQGGTQVLEIAPTVKIQQVMNEAGMNESVMKTPKMRQPRRFDTPMSAPAKIATCKLKPVEEIPCQICDVYVGDYEQLLKHVKKHHMDVDGVDDYIEEVQMEMQVDCPVCNLTIESQTELTFHIEREHSHIGTEIRCEPCEKTYKSAASLKNHIRQQHTARKRFECHVCSATFTETRSLREHINCVHETTETFDCDVCGKTFLTKGRLRRHKYIHGGFRHFCEYCNKGFHLRDNMNKHVEIMHEQKFGKRFQCNYCGKAFTVKGNLQQHILGVHLKKSLYECPICNEGFKRKSMMLDHMKSHARPKIEPGIEQDEHDGVQRMDPDELAALTKKMAEQNEGETSGEEDYDYVEFD